MRDHYEHAKHYVSGVAVPRVTTIDVIVLVAGNDPAIEEYMQTITVRYAKHFSGAWGYIVSVTNGPQDLLFRYTEADARADGAAYVAKHYCQPLVSK